MSIAGGRLSDGFVRGFARRDRIEGDVQVCFNVDREGRPYRIAVRNSTNRVFEKPAIKAATRSRYKPRVIDGVASGAANRSKTSRRAVSSFRIWEA